MSPIEALMRRYFDRRATAIPVITTGLKAVEEANELVEALVSGDRDRIIQETADLVIVCAVVALQYGFTVEDAIVIKGTFDLNRGEPKQDPRT